MDLLLRGIVRESALLGLAAAALWGGGDFSGGMGVKRAGGGIGAALRVVLMSHAASFATLLLVERVRGDAFPHGAVLAWGIAAGVAGGLSLTAFYTALSRGAMGASAAVSGLLAAAIPAAVGMAQEGSPGRRAVAGFAVAAVAIWLIAAGDRVHGVETAEEAVHEHEAADAARRDAQVRAERRATARQTMLLAVAAGAGFGVYFIALKMANPAGVVWPMATARMGSLTVCGLMLLGRSLRRWDRPSEAEAAQVRITPAAVRWALAAALLDTSGNLLFIAATRAGRLDVASVLASLYPASTILLAAVTLGELPTKRQAVGMLAAAAAVVMIAM
jgi:drug/metabolite transporter (DMT)-like permease